MQLCAILATACGLSKELAPEQCRMMRIVIQNVMFFENFGENGSKYLHNRNECSMLRVPATLGTSLGQAGTAF
jgi:hypothetical protein